MRFWVPILILLALVHEAPDAGAAGRRSGTTADDLTRRSPEINWPEGFDPAEAQSFAHNELTIEAGCGRVWDHLVDVARWPSWLVIAKDARVVAPDGSLRSDTRFRWTIFDLPIESHVHEYVEGSRIGWFAYLPGQKPQFYHTWHLTPTGEACRVVTEEVGLGPDAE